MEHSICHLPHIGEKEIVICAAVRANDGFIARGHRHHHCLAVLRAMDKKYTYADGSEGFITSRNRYVDRKEGYAIQIAAGIESVCADPSDRYLHNELYSEDLY